jgi:hypothetical protein
LQRLLFTNWSLDRLRDAHLITIAAGRGSGDPVIGRILGLPAGGVKPARARMSSHTLAISD